MYKKKTKQKIMSIYSPQTYLSYQLIPPDKESTNDVIGLERFIIYNVYNRLNIKNSKCVIFFLKRISVTFQQNKTKNNLENFATFCIQIINLKLN